MSKEDKLAVNMVLYAVIIMTTMIVLVQTFA